MIRSIRDMQPQAGPENWERLFEIFKQEMIRLFELEKSHNQGALKVLHKPQDARDYNLSKERIKNELKAMSDIQHPHLLKLIEYDNEENWFVSEFHPNGTLNCKTNLFLGKARDSLKMIRPLVAGVAELHKNQVIHRDIKPQNIFVNYANQLVLGDFGLVFFTDNQHTRVSNTFSNVGSRDWMPGWAMAKRIEEVNPTFDVFALGKIIWSMISGIPTLPLWYFKDYDNDLEQLFPKRREMKLINTLLSKCIVEREKDCIPNGNILLEEIDNTIDRIESKIDKISFNENRPCRICGQGTYEVLSKGNNDITNNFGIRSVGNRHFLVFTCNYCGNVQLFTYDLDVLPKAWEN